MKNDTLNLVLSEDITQHQGGRLVVATPDLLINGVRLFRSEAPVVDTLGLLIHSAHSGAFDLLTCTCGVAGCAGFHEEVEVLADNSIVRWTIPALGYTGALAEAFGPGPWTFSFDKVEFNQALHDFEQALLAAECAQGRLGLSPWGPYDDEDAVVPVEDILTRCRARFQLYQREEQCFHEAFGASAHQDLCMSASGCEFWFSVRQFAWAAQAAADLPFRPETDEEFEAQAAVWRSAAAALKASPVDALLALPDEQLDAYARAWNRAEGRWDSSVSWESLSGSLRQGGLSVTLGVAP